MATRAEFYMNDIHIYFPSPPPKRAYIVERRGAKMLHMPPKSKPLSQERYSRFCGLGEITALGVRGVQVEDMFKPADTQKCWLNWAAIDVDAEGQWPVLGELGNGCSWQEMLERVLEGCAHVRASKSGEGRHVLFMFDKPYEFFGVTAAAAAARAFVKPWVDKLNAAGIQTCVSGLPNLWVWSEGGKQSWIYMSKVKHPLSYFAPVAQTHVNFGPYIMSDCVQVSGDGPGIEIVHRLWDHCIIRGDSLNCRPLTVDRHTNINVGRVKEALKDLMPFKTKSKCRPEHAGETNGFIEIDEYSVSLFSSADNTGPGAGWLFKIPLD